MKRPAAVNPIDANVMRRLDSLEWLIDQEYEGKPKLFEERTGIKMAQVGQWFSGYRALREKALRRLEECTGKQEGWFDQPEYMRLSSNSDQWQDKQPLIARGPYKGSQMVQVPVTDAAYIKEKQTEAVEFLSACLDTLGAEEQKEMSAVLAAWVRAPDSPKIKKSLIDLLPSTISPDYVLAKQPAPDYAAKFVNSDQKGGIVQQAETIKNRDINLGDVEYHPARR